MEQVPRDLILGNIAKVLGQVEEEAAVQTTELMTDRVSGACTLANIAEENIDSQGLNDRLSNKAIEELSAIENALAKDTSHLADLQRVRIAEAWSKLKQFERVQSIAQQINDSRLKSLALRYAGISVEESEYDRLVRLCTVCESTSQQSDAEEGMKVLNSLLQQTAFLIEEYRRSFLICIVKVYFSLLRKVS